MLGRTHAGNMNGLHLDGSPSGTDADGVAQCEVDYCKTISLLTLSVCLQWFDGRDLAEVADHMNDDGEIEILEDPAPPREVSIPQLKHAPVDASTASIEPAKL